MSNRVPDLKLGKLPPDPSKPRLKLAAHLTATPTYPPQQDFLTRVRDWGMYLNDRIGDCTFAQAAHVIKALSLYGKGTEESVTDADVLKGYRDVSGYDPATGANDNGCYLQDVMNYWRKTGVGGHKILAFAEVDIRNMDEVRAAINTFGSLTIGFAFPAIAMSQFSGRKPWDVVANDGGIEGGHAVNIGAYNTSSKYLTAVTWGDLQAMSEDFWKKYVDEAWVAITPEWLNANGTSPGGVDLYGLGEELARLTGGSNPFPKPNPTPQPAPTPDPVPAPTPASGVTDTSFMHEWLNGAGGRRPFFYKAFQKKLAKWLDENGL